MSVPVLIIGDSGSGKSRSLKDLDPKETLVIQPVRKPLPFRAKGWSTVKPDNDGLNGSIAHTVDYGMIRRLITHGVRTGKKEIIIDDSNYLLTMAELGRSGETGFQKFVDFAKNHVELITLCQSLPDDVCVYFMTHSQLDMHGAQRPKTTGKMLDEKVCIEGLFSIVLGCQVRDGQHFFTTTNSGSDCVKAPEEMFDSAEIENNLANVSSAIRAYY